MIIVTGGAGLIGNWLIRELNERGESDIIIVDRLVDPNQWKNLLGCRFKEYMMADAFLERKEEFSSARAIFHLGAISHTTCMDVVLLDQLNVQYSKDLWSFCSQYQIPFLYASSGATYGDGALGYKDDHDLSFKLRPLNPYGFSKWLFDNYALQTEQAPPHWFGFKFFNVFGPPEHHKAGMRSMVCKGFEQIQAGGVVKLFKSDHPDYKDGGQLRDFVYVKDVVLAMLRFYEEPPSSGLYNLGTGKARSFFDLIQAVFKTLKKETNIQYIPTPDNIKNQYQYFTQADMGKFYGAFSDFKFRELEPSVEDYVSKHLMK